MFDGATLTRRSAPTSVAVPAGTTPATSATIAGLGAATPSRVVSADELSRRLGVSAEWIFKRTGTGRRPVCDERDSVVELAALAAERALLDAGSDPLEVDLLMVATTTQEQLLPNAAPLVAATVGCENAGAVDLGAACTGFLTGLALGIAQIESGRARNVVVVGADAWTRFVDQHDARVAPLWGDGAGAVVLRAGDGERAAGPVLLRCDGRLGQLIRMERGEQLLHMEGAETFDHATRNLAGVSAEAVLAAGLSLDDIDLFVFHQANARITRAVVQRLGVAHERVVDCIHETGNTGAASLPLALAHARAAGRLRAGQRLLLGAVGAGMCWGATVLEWRRSR